MTVGSQDALGSGWEAASKDWAELHWMSLLVSLALQYGLADFFRFLPVSVPVWNMTKMGINFFFEEKY